MKAIYSLFTVSFKVISFVFIFISFGSKEGASQSCVPPALFSAANISTTRCHNQNITFTNPNGLSGQYRFRFFTSTNAAIGVPQNVAPNGTVSQPFPSGTGYKAVLIRQDAACKDSVIVSFNVDAFPAAPAFTNNGPKCANTATGFNVTGPVGGLAYSWTFGDFGSGASNSATGITANHVYPIALNGLEANYNVILTATSLQGCATPGAGVSVAVKATPRETFNKNTDIKPPPSEFSGKSNSASDFERNTSNGKTYCKPTLSFKNKMESRHPKVISKHLNSKTQGGKPLSTSSTVSCPPNIGFESGDFSNWVLGTGIVKGIEYEDPNGNLFSCAHGCSSTGLNEVIITNGPASADHHVIYPSTAQPILDPYGNFSINPPDGSNFALKLGNDKNDPSSNRPNALAERATYKLKVPANSLDYSITYSYAVVFEDPGHLAINQPRFSVNLVDSATGESVPCSFVEYIADSTIDDFQESPDFEDVWYKDWTPAFINLSKYGGKTLYLEFTTADCTHSGHWGYAYLDVNNCEIQCSANNSCALPKRTRVEGPPGFIQYNWLNQNYQPIASGQIAIINPALPDGDSLFLEVIPYSGPACRDTIVVRIESDSLIIDKGTDKVICSGSNVKIGSSTIVPNCIYSWSSNIPISNSDQNTIDVNPTTTTNFILNIIDTISKCKSYDTIQVKVNPTPYAEITPNTSIICSGNSMQFANNSSPGLAYLWKSLGTPALIWNNNTNQFTPGPTPPINNPGVYLFELQVTDALSGCKSIDTARVNVIPVTNASWNIGPLEGCDSLNVLITDFSQDGDSSRVWFDNGGVLTIPKISNQISIKFHNPDTVSAYLVSYGKCSSDTTQIKSMRIRKSPDAGFSTSTDQVAIWPTDTVTICKGEQVQFTNLFTGTIGVSHDWNFGDGPIGSAQESCSHIYNQEGLFEVKLKEAYNSEPNCPKIVRKWVRVNPLPIAGFNGPLVVCQGATVTYTNTSQNCSFFTWYLINGTTIIDSVQNVSQWSFNAPNTGNYKIRLKSLSSISNSFCSSILEKSIIVQLPLASFNILNQTICLYDSLRIVNFSQSGLNYSWFLGGSNIPFSSATNPIPVMITTHGQNSVVLKVQNPLTGCVNWDTAFVSVSTSPRTVARFQVFPPYLGCDSLKVTFKDFSSFSENSIGVLGNGQYIQFPLPTTTKDYTYPDTGRFRTRVIAQGICNTDTSNGPLIRVFPNPKADFWASTATDQNWINDTIVICVNDTVRFKNQYPNQSAVKHSWYFEESNSFSNLINPPTLTFLNQGIFLVKLKTISDSGFCTREKIKYVRVKPLPSISLVTQPSIVCENSPILINASATTNAEFFRWQINESGITSQFDTVANKLTYNFLTVGLANTFIKLIAYNSQSRSTCFSEITRPVVVKPKPKPAISWTDSQGCAPLRIKFSRNSESFGSQETVLWSFGDNRFSASQDLQLNPITYQNNDSVEHVLKVKLEVKYDGCQDSSFKVVRVFPVPQAGFNLISGIQLEQRKARIVLVENLLPNSSQWVRFYDFGDGKDTLVIGGRNDTITHWYDTVGQYTLIQKVMDWRYPDTCRSLSQIFITVNQSLPVADFLIDGQDSSSICEDDSVVFTNTSRFVTLNSEWDFGNGKKTRLTGDERHKPIVIPYLNPGRYTIRLVVQNEKGKDTLIKTTSVQVNPKPDTRFKLDPEISKYPIVENSRPFQTLNQTTGGARFFWNFGEFPEDTLEAFDTTYKYTIPGEYTISLVSISDMGCLDTFRLKPTMEAYLAGLWVPDVFSPGSSVKANQYWKVFHRNAEDFEAIVYNQWGEQIFYTRDLDFKWDGTFEGRECPNGSYNFVVRYRLRGLRAEKGEIQTISKVVTIKR